MTTATASSNPCAAFFQGLRDAFSKLPAPTVAPQMQGATQAAEAAANETGGDSSPAAQSSKCCPPPDWMPIAIAELNKNVQETADSSVHPRIQAYFDASRFWGTDDSGGANAWCASFVAYVMKTAGYGIATDAFRAKEWMNRWSAGKNAGRPIYGAIAVKSRTGGGHVGFVMGKTPGKAGYLEILGGNQRNKLSVATYAQSDFLAYMVPDNYAHSCCVLEDYSGSSSGAAGSES